MLKLADDFLLPLSDNLRKGLLHIAQTFRNHHRQCYLVGGAVRDLLLARSVDDLDLTTDAHPEQIMKYFRRVIPTGIKHGTVTVLLDDHAFEITTFRTDGDYADARRPDKVRFSDSLQEDLKRRDFTINALAFDPIAKQLIDEHHGMKDLQAKIIRTIGDPVQRFREDALRPVRACRFAATLGFELESETRLTLGKEEILKRASLIAVERFSDELKKGLDASEVSRMIRPLQESGLLSLFFRLQNESLPVTDESTLQALDALHETPTSYKLAFWLQGLHLQAKDIPRFTRSLKFSGKYSRDILWSERLMRFFIEADLYPPDAIELRKFISLLKEKFRDESESFLSNIPERLFPEQYPRDQWINSLAHDPLRASDLAVNGRDLMGRGYSGPRLGAAMQYLLDIVLEDPERNRREILLNLLDEGRKN